MRVTKEKLTADVACANMETCDGCEYKRRNCVDDRERNDYAYDLLEARELIKEMRQMLVIAKAYNCDCSCKSCKGTLSDINTILERTKEYM